MSPAMHAAVGAATAEVSRLRDELDAVLAVGDAKLRSAERLCSKLRGDGDRKAAAIDTLELRIADADARRDRDRYGREAGGVELPLPERLPAHAGGRRRRERGQANAFIGGSSIDKKKEAVRAI